MLDTEYIGVEGFGKMSLLCDDQSMTVEYDALWCRPVGPVRVERTRESSVVVRSNKGMTTG
jgi:hypothetical protein